MNKQQKLAFTLIELIVVISVLSILGTIAFISYQGYSSEARNTKRTTDLSNLVKAIEIKLIGGTNLKDFVNGTGSTIKNNISISGFTGSYLSISNHYKAGDINYKTIGVNENSFKDPLTNDSYKIGITTLGNKYEIAATYENGNNSYSIVKGNWDPRKTNATKLYRDHINNNEFYITGSTSEIQLRVGDQVKIGSHGGYIITKIFKNIIQVNKNIIPASTIFLSPNESRHLIRKRSTSDYPISTKNEGGTYHDTPYNILK